MPAHWKPPELELYEEASYCIPPADSFHSWDTSILCVPRNVPRVLLPIDLVSSSSTRTMCGICHVFFSWIWPSSNEGGRARRT